MRPSNRTPILEAAVRVAEAKGISGVTMEAVAEQAGLTKGGLMYHFASKEALLIGIQEHLAALWERDLEAAAGKPAQEATTHERLVAYVRVSARAATRAELIMQIESTNDPTLNEPWSAVLGRWRPALDPNPTDEAALRTYIAVLAADGLWTADTLGIDTIDEQTRARIVQHIISDLHI